MYLLNTLLLNYYILFSVPGHYEVKDDLLHESAKVPFSSFKSSSKRQMQPDPAPVSISNLYVFKSSWEK